MQDKLLHNYSGKEIMFSVALVCLFVRPVAGIFEKGVLLCGLWTFAQCKREKLEPFWTFFCLIRGWGVGVGSSDPLYPPPSYTHTHTATGLFVCLSFCLSVANITPKAMNGLQ